MMIWTKPTDTARRRIARKTDRKDFMTRILEQRDPDEVSDLQLAAHASDFVLAGSETTATAMGTITYYLLRNPDIMARLQREIRAAFKSYGEICDKATLPLPYLKAVILEGLRMYPPLPFALPRVVPDPGDTVDGHYLPGGVSNAIGKGVNSRRTHADIARRRLFQRTQSLRALTQQISRTRWRSSRRGGWVPTRRISSRRASRFRSGRGHAWAESQYIQRVQNSPN